ncbi:dTDP-4-dehydrorhamnose reductase [uncultured Kriegella sp.]|uniref:dTDP-4-dehydrorhamnose reductase n=1 Tax=uncultured Kriegella sp. TaxID=1798910 RepID=UPI0030DD4094|tara:strand:+ start:145499 stop:146284 length:786 start_codon:yes stop_codon:yes gene_type:complete
MMRILVTGSGGQLAKCIKKIAPNYKSLSFVFKDSKELDITDKGEVDSTFGTGGFDFCINCAAYTNVDDAERFPELAFAVNAEGVKNLAEACSSNEVKLIHISTDYVFDGTKQGPYLPEDAPNPINVYGKSKLKGEQYIQELLKQHYIVRTSWLYSEYGSNFYKTILKKAKTEKKLSITTDQIGCPTNANNLALFLMGFVKAAVKPYGIYHFTDGEAMTWYEFAARILRENRMDDVVRLEKVKNYRTFAIRPKNSVLKIRHD